VHISDGVSTAKQYSAKLLCAAKTTWDLKPYALRNLYISVVENTILYASCVWLGAFRKKNVQQLFNSAERVPLIIISKSFRSALR
jgi:hypothetical protein